MKNNILHTLHRGVVAMLAVAALLACDDEEFVREAGKQPAELTALGADLYRPGKVDSRVLLTYDNVTDILRCRITNPAPKSLGIALKVDEEAVADYNLKKGTELKLFPTEKVTLFYDTALSEGAKESADLRVTFERQGVEKGRYLLPLTLHVEGSELSPTYYYEVSVFEETQEVEFGSLRFKSMVYVNTQIVNPLIITQFPLAKMDIMTGDMNSSTWIDHALLGKAHVELDPQSGRAELNIDADLQYVLYNRAHYVQPLQKNGRKVLIAINNSTTLGLCNMTDEQIADVVFGIRKAVEDYQIDGVNFFDLDADYTSMAPVIPASYAKLIKATKEALGKKLVTVACDEQSTDLLAVPQEGIQAGQYIDYAWSGIFDQVVDAYTAGSKLKPIAGLDQKNYGAMMMQSGNYTTNWLSKHQEELITMVNDLYWNNSASANVFAFFDIPLSRSGLEKGGAESFNILFEEALSNFEYSEDLLIYCIDLSGGYFNFYGQYAKDW